MIYQAHTLQNYFASGLVLAGQNEDGELEFIGTDKQWDKAKKLEFTYQYEKIFKI